MNKKTVRKKEDPSPAAIALSKKLECYSRYNFWISSVEAAQEEKRKERSPIDVSELIDKMAEIRNFVESLPSSTEKLFLYYHYVSGMSMEATAELLGLSLRSTYRLKNRSLEFAADVVRHSFGTTA